MNETQSQVPVFADGLTQTIVQFLADIGLDVRAAPIEEETVLPGILIQAGELVVDESQLKYPGDLLHEAGHLAIVGPKKRCRLGVDVGIKVAEELTAIAWSWAALTHLDLQPEVVFHANGYNGESESLIEAFSNNRGPGLPTLAWMEMCGDPNPGPDALPSDLPLFPAMTHWLRQADDPV